MADDDDLHPLLRRQARRAGISDPAQPTQDVDAWRDFLGRIGRTFESAERDRYLLERSLELSSAEMQELHSRLARDKELLDSVLGALSSGVLHFDATWRVTFANAAGRRLLMLRDDPERTPASELFVLESTAGERISTEAVAEELQAGQAVVHDDVFVIRPDRTSFPASVTFNPMVGDDGLTGVVMSLTDNTERKRALIAAQQARIEAEAAERARLAQAAFLANMSHELRTPLNAVLGYSELVLEDAEILGYAEVVPDLRKIHTAGRHLLQLINDVLDMSKIQAGRLDLTLAEIDVALLIREVAETVAPTVRKNGNALQIRPHEDVGLIQTDALRLKQALINVIGNAGKFTHDGMVSVTLEACDDDVLIIVQDTGIGMDAGTLQRIFEPFTQADTSTTRKYGGTGLGLAITHSICTALHATLTVDSVPGKGSTFRFAIPRRFPTSVAGIRKTQPLEAVRVATGEQIVLLIDDDHASHELMERYFSGRSIRLYTASSGREGLDMARKLHPDAIILDIILPDMQGWDVLSILKSDPQTSAIPLVVVSIVAEAPRAFQLGAQDYLVKPVDRARLLELLRKFRTHEKNPTVLVVEDDEDLRLILCKKIERDAPQWEVWQASSGVEACQALSGRGTPDLVLLDLMMPEMDGFEFLDVLRNDRNWATIPVVVVTALNLSDAQRRQLDAQVDRIVEKAHFTASQIAESVIDLLAHSSTTAESEP